MKSYSLEFLQIDLGHFSSVGEVDTIVISRWLAVVFETIAHIVPRFKSMNLLRIFYYFPTSACYFDLDLDSTLLRLLTRYWSTRPEGSNVLITLVNTCRPLSSCRHLSVIDLSTRLSAWCSPMLINLSTLVISRTIFLHFHHLCSFTGFIFPSINNDKNM